MTEPVPTREKRRGILVFEGTEGGAGVLGRLVAEGPMLSRVARAALDVMHYADIDKAIEANDPALLKTDSEADCVKGCYRCLLSYYNQTDQEFIDRNDSVVLRILLRLARSTVTPDQQPHESETSDPWSGAFKQWGLPTPTGTPLVVDGVSLRFVWPQHRVAADTQPINDGIRGAADALGYVVVALPNTPLEAPPAELTKLLKGDS